MNRKQAFTQGAKEPVMAQAHLLLQAKARQNPEILQNDYGMQPMKLIA